MEAFSPDINSSRSSLPIPEGKGKGRYSFSWLPHLRATGRHLPYGITQCYLPPHTNEYTPSNPSHVGWYSIYLPRGMEGWVDLVDLIAPRPGVEPVTFRSRVQRRTAAPPRHRKCHLRPQILNVIYDILCVPTASYMCHVYILPMLHTASPSIGHLLLTNLHCSASQLLNPEITEWRILSYIFYYFQKKFRLPAGVHKGSSTKMQTHRLLPQL